MFIKSCRVILQTLSKYIIQENREISTFYALFPKVFVWAVCIVGVDTIGSDNPPTRATKTSHSMIKGNGKTQVCFAVA